MIYECSECDGDVIEGYGWGCNDSLCYKCFSELVEKIKESQRDDEGGTTE